MSYTDEAHNIIEMLGRAAQSSIDEMESWLRPDDEDNTARVVDTEWVSGRPGTLVLVTDTGQKWLVVVSPMEAVTVGGGGPQPQACGCTPTWRCGGHALP